MYDYQVTNSEGRVFDKLVFISWYVCGCCRCMCCGICSVRTVAALPVAVLFAIPGWRSTGQSALLCRSPDNARIKNKMMYASTKDFFKSYLEVRPAADGHSV